MSATPPIARRAADPAVTPCARPASLAGAAPAAGPPADLALARAIFRREWRPALLATALALVVGGAALGRAIAARALLPDPAHGQGIPIASILSLQDFALWLLSRALPLPIAVAAGVAAVSRLADDWDAPWLATLVALGTSRGRYVASVAAAVASSRLALYAALLLGYLAGVATLDGLDGRPATLAAELLRGLPGVAALLASSSLYGTGCIALARARAPALALALAGVVAPLALASWLGTHEGGQPLPPLARPITWLMPPPSWSTSADALLRHAIYSATLLALLAALAPRWVARDA